MIMLYYALSVFSAAYFFICEVGNMLETLLENLQFVAVSGLIAAAIALAAKFSERFFQDLHKVRPARRVTIIAICGAIAAVLHMLDFPLLFLERIIMIVLKKKSKSLARVFLTKINGPEKKFLTCLRGLNLPKYLLQRYLQQPRKIR